MVSDIYLYKKCEWIRFLKDELILDNIRGFDIHLTKKIGIMSIRILLIIQYRCTNRILYLAFSYSFVSSSFYGKVTPSKTFYVPWVLRLILHVIGNLYFTRINLFLPASLPPRHHSNKVYHIKCSFAYISVWFITVKYHFQTVHRWMVNKKADLPRSLSRISFDPFPFQIIYAIFCFNIFFNH